MKKIIVLQIVWLSLLSHIYAQTSSNVIHICNQAYVIKTSLQADDKILLTVDNQATKDSFYMDKNISHEEFSVRLKSTLKKFTADSILSLSCYQNHLNEAIFQTYTQLKINTSITSQATAAGVFKLKQDFNVYNITRFDSKIKNKKSRVNIGLSSKMLEDTFFKTFDDQVYYPQWELINVKCEIVNGFIQNLEALVKKKSQILIGKNAGKIQEENIRFVLPYSVGLTSFANFSELKNVRLLSLQNIRPRRIGNTTFSVSEYLNMINDPETYKVKDESFYLILGELIEFDNYFGVERRDYSPMDTSFNIKPGEAITLLKDETKKLFEAKIFSDVIGLEETKPNGLIQVEVQKRINLNTEQKPNYFMPTRYLWKSWGMFNHLSPIITISKIEEHNKRLPTSQLQQGNPYTYDDKIFTKANKPYASFLDLYRYQYFSGGFDLNVITLYNHHAKYDISINAGVRLGLTQLFDSTSRLVNDTLISVVNKYTVSTLQFVPELKFRLLPEERFNFAANIKFVYGAAMSDKAYFVRTNTEDNTQILLQQKAWMFTPDLIMSVFLGKRSDNKVYARLQYNMNTANTKENFAQVQIGYSTYILSK